MQYTSDHMSELNLLSQFETGDPTVGLKVHSTATPESIAAAERLHEKGLTSQVDGGYLTPRGIAAAEHARSLLSVLSFDAEHPHL